MAVAVLRDNGKDVDATAVKVFLLIELSKFEDTLAFLGTQLDGGAAHSFEKVGRVALSCLACTAGCRCFLRLTPVSLYRHTACTGLGDFRRCVTQSAAADMHAHALSASAWPALHTCALLRSLCRFKMSDSHVSDVLKGTVQAMEAAAAIPDNQAAAKLQLQAQLHYRLSQYSAAIRVYEQLGASHKVGCIQMYLLCSDHT